MALVSVSGGVARFLSLEKVPVKVTRWDRHEQYKEWILIGGISRVASTLLESAKADTAEAPIVFTAEKLRKGWLDQYDPGFCNVVTTGSVTRYPTMQLLDTETGVEAWFYREEGGGRRILVAAWDRNGNEDQRIGRSPVWVE